MLCLCNRYYWCFHYNFIHLKVLNVQFSLQIYSTSHGVINTIICAHACLVAFQYYIPVHAYSGVETASKK